MGVRVSVPFAGVVPLRLLAVLEELGDLQIEQRTQTARRQSQTRAKAGTSILRYVRELR